MGNSPSGLGLGKTFNFVSEASGVSIPLTRAGSVAFLGFVAAGNQIFTVTEVDSTGVNSEQALDVQFNPHNGPGVGGQWFALAEQDDTVDNGGDATNDTLYIDVQGVQLSDGYDSVQCTTSTGTCNAIIYDLEVARKPANLKSSIVA